MKRITTCGGVMPERFFVSPSFTSEKLESPTYGDLVDVFEDRMRKWLFKPAQTLLATENGEVAAVALILSYFEGIEMYRTGQDSSGSSKKFFRNGIKRVFDVAASHAHVFDAVIDSIYAEARCGFAHDGLFRNRVFFSDATPESLTVTWPKKNGEFVADGQLESVVINAARFIDGVVKHFDRYIAALRAETDAQLKENFLTTVRRKWGLDEGGRVIGMTEGEFFGDRSTGL